MKEVEKVVPPLVIWGASGHARVVCDIVRLTGKYAIAGFLDDINHDKHGTAFCDSIVLGGNEKLEMLLSKNIKHMLIGVGDCNARMKISEHVFAMGFSLAKAIHPSSIISDDARIGEGTVVTVNAVVNPGAFIGNNVILNTASTIDHDCKIENGVHIGPGVHLGGNVFVDQATWIGIGSSIKDNVRIGKNTIIGAGSVVIRDIPDNVVAYGNPAKVIREHNL